MADPSPFEVDEMVKIMQESGTMDAALEGLGIEPPAPVETDSVEDIPTPVDTDAADDTEEVESPEIEAETTAAPESTEEEDAVELFLDLTPETEAILGKYDYDLNKALDALQHREQTIGRQGNELGDVKRQLQELQDMLVQQNQRPQWQPQSYPAFPEEYDDPDEAVETLEQIAEQAFANNDPQTFERAMAQWKQVDPRGVRTYGQLKAMQIQIAESQQQQAPAAQTEDTVLQDGVTRLVQQYPQLQTEEFQVKLGEEIQRYPTLGRVLNGEVPGVTPAERLAAMEEFVGRLVDRQDADTREKAARRVAVRTSEEARQARLEAQVGRSTQSTEVSEEKASRQIRMGDTNATIDEDATMAQVRAILGDDVQLHNAPDTARSKK